MQTLKMPHSHNYGCRRLLKCSCRPAPNSTLTPAKPNLTHKPVPGHTTEWAVIWTEKEEGLFSKLGSLLLITGQQTASQGHEQCVVAEQRAFSLESVRLSVRERERTVCCGHWLLQRTWAPCQLRLWALIKKENLYPASGHGSVGQTGASSWSLPAHTSWDSSLQTPKEREDLGRCPAAFTGVCHLPVNCQILLIPSVPSSEDQSNNVD